MITTLIDQVHLLKDSVISRWDMEESIVIRKIQMPDGFYL